LTVIAESWMYPLCFVF